MTKSEKQKDISLKIRIKPLQKKTPEKSTSSSSSTWNHCVECGISFSSTKALFGHLRIHRKNNRGSEKPSFSTFRQAKHADVMAACILMGMRRSKSEADISDAKLIQLKWICAKIERQRKMKMKEATSNKFENYHSLISEMLTPSMLALQEQNIAQCEKSSTNEEMNVGAVVEMAAPSQLATVEPAEMEVHQCDKCDKVFDSGQALGGHKRAHYNGPPLYRLRGNLKWQRAVNAVAAEVVVYGFNLNEAAEKVFL